MQTLQQAAQPWPVPPPSRIPSALPPWRIHALWCWGTVCVWLCHRLLVCVDLVPLTHALQRMLHRVVHATKTHICAAQRCKSVLHASARRVFTLHAYVLQAKALHSKLVSFFTDHARDRDKSISLAAGVLQTDAPARQQAGAGTGHPPSVPQTAAHTVLG